MQKIDTILIVSPDGYAHSQCFFEVALAMREALSTFQLPPLVTTDPARISGTTLVFGAHLIPHVGGTISGGDYIIYNTEQVRQDSTWFSDKYIEILKSYPVWDYAAQNVTALRDNHGIEAAHCPIGYSPSMSNIQRSESATIVGGGTRGAAHVGFAPWGFPPASDVQDIEVLFAGSLNERRSKIIEDLRESGLQVIHAVGYGEYRDKLISRAKVVLNLHYFDDSPEEDFRLSHLWANRRWVVSEGIPDMAYACKRAVADDAERRKNEVILFNAFSNISFKDTLYNLLGGYAQ